MRVIVIGAGVVGAAAGYELARSGVDTVMVDAGRKGRATSAGAGIICPWTSRLTDPDRYRMAAAGAEHYPGLLAALAEDGETEVGYRRAGALRLLAPEAAAEAESVRATVAARAAASAVAGEVSLIDRGEAATLFPPLRHEGPAIHVAGAARLDGRLLRAALRRGATRHGARLVEAEARVEAAGGRVVAVHTGGERLTADAVIDAAGAWSAALLEPLGVRLPVVPQRGQIVHLRLPGADTSRWPVVLPPTGHYLLAFDDSRIVVGATREDGSGFDHRVTAAGLAEVLNEALAVAPGLAGATHLETRVGLRPTGPDLLPLLGPVPGLRGLVVANGLGASGLTMGPYAGSLAARLALGTEPGMDLTAYAPLR